MDENKTRPMHMKIGLRMALLILGVSICITSAAIMAGTARFQRMQIEANKEISYKLGRSVACLMDQESVTNYINEVKEIYDAAPPELRDVPAEPDAELTWSVEGGAYESLFTPVMTDDYKIERRNIRTMAEEIGALDVSIVVMDIENGRIVNVISDIGDRQYQDLYTEPGFWAEIDDFVLDYAKSGDPDKVGCHMMLDLNVAKGNQPIQAIRSVVPFYDYGSGEILAYVLIDRPWFDLDSDRTEFVTGFLMMIGLITIVLVILSEIVMNFAILRPLKRVTTEQARMATELDVASNIQLSMLPEEDEVANQGDNYHIHGVLRTAKEVGGDFYDYFAIDKDHVAICIGDVVGKGVPASLFSMMARAYIRMSAMNGYEPRVVMEQTNNMLSENNRNAMFATAWFGILNISELSLCYVNAGHDDPVIFHRDEDNAEPWKIVDEEHNLVLGIMGDTEYDQRTISLSKGDKLLIYTDGVPEAQANEIDLYGEERFTECLNNMKDVEGRDILEGVFKDIDAYVHNAPQFDDITMVLLEL